MSYSEFVKKHYDMVRELPPKERFAAIAKMYHDSKGKAHGKVKGGMEVAGALSIPKKHSKAHSKAKGGMVVGGLIVGGSEPSSPMSAHSMDRDPLGLRSMMF